MSNSYSAEVWLDSRRWDALEAVLEAQGTSIERHLQDYLVDLYREMVPAEQAAEIEAAIRQEDLKELQEREARKVFSAFLLGDPQGDRYFVTERPNMASRPAAGKTGITPFRCSP